MDGNEDDDEADDDLDEGDDNDGDGGDEGDEADVGKPRVSGTRFERNSGKERPKNVFPVPCA